MRLLPLVTILTIITAASGAEPKRAGPDWWSLQPVVRPDVPNFADADASAIDALVRVRRDAAGLRQSPPADKGTLIRRVTFDLTGLPPTPADIDAFVADSMPDAYERLVDRLLASPALGERWARHWLDVVRYSESHGFEYDRLRDNAWRYRDYVIRSLNADKPYSDFVREQIAGDVLHGGTRDGVIATGMLVSGPYDQAGLGSASAVIRGKAREDELEDMLSTVAQTFLGVTLNCARCHDHKFDPYAARDYYRLKAVFEGVFPGDRPVSAPNSGAILERERRLAELREWVRRVEVRARERIVAKRDPAARVPDPVAKPIARWAFDRDGRDSIGSLHTELKSGARITGGRLVVDGKGAFAASTSIDRDLAVKTLEAWVILPTLKQAGGGVVSVQTLNGGVFDAIVFAEQKPLRWLAGSDSFRRTRDVAGSDETAKAGALIHLAITYAADGRITIYRNGRPYGDSYVPEGPKKATAFAAKQAQVVFGMRHTGGGNAFLQGEIEEARLYDRALTADEVRASYRAGVECITLEELLGALGDDEQKAIRDAEAELARLENELAEHRRTALAYAANAKPPGRTVILKRGDFEKPGEPVTPGSPAVVKGPPPVESAANAAEADRRRAFSEWVIHPDNPLAWRVIANRVWQHHFGEGLVRTPNDFGFNGERPTHPELLDWLACELRDSGGRLKHLHRLIVMSATYRQASAFDARSAGIDADNRLLWRYAPRRLEAEALRDAMLAASGKLNREAGGPSFRPFRIETFNSAFYVPFDEDRSDFNRRAVYRMNVTSARDPVLDVLDCPDPSVKTPRRNATTTPLQALTMMNSAFTNRLASAFSERVQREAGHDASAQVVLAYRLALGRNPSDVERDRAMRVVREAGLRAVCWALFNSSEFAFLK